MDDNLIRKEKFKNSAAFPITVGDLYFRAVNPIYNKQVVLNPGEYILTELLDFNDLKKSRISGALSQFIRMGWIVVENPAEEVKVVEATRLELKFPETAKVITEVQAGTVNPKDITNLVATAAQPKDSVGFPTDTQPKVVELISQQESRTTNTFAIGEQAAAKVATEDGYQKFESLKYFQKLKTIKETTDMRLLEAIATKSNYPQLVHNSRNRIRELQSK